MSETLKNTCKEVYFLSNLGLVEAYTTLLKMNSFADISQTKYFQSICFSQGSHRFLNFKIKEKQGDLRKNFQIFDEKFEKNKGESRRF